MSIKLKDPSDLYYLNWAKNNFEAEEEAQGLDSKEDSKGTEALLLLMTDGSLPHGAQSCG